MRLWSLSARTTPRAARGAQAKAEIWSRLRSIHGRFRPCVSVLTSEQCLTISATAVPNRAHVVPGRGRVLDHVVKQARDHDVLVEPRSIQDQCHRGDMLEIGCPAAAARLPVVTLRGPAHGLFQPFGNHSTVSCGEVFVLTRRRCRRTSRTTSARWVKKPMWPAFSIVTNRAPGCRRRGPLPCRRDDHVVRAGQDQTGHIDPPEAIRDIEGFELRQPLGHHALVGLPDPVDHEIDETGLAPASFHRADGKTG